MKKQTLPEAISHLEKEMVSDALKANRTEAEAAARLGIEVSALQALAKKYGFRSIPNEKKTCPVCASLSDSFLPESGFDLKSGMDAIEKAIVMDAVEKTKGNKKAAARFLNLEYHALLYLVEKHSLKA
jgi:transcriptional regulator with GAF, ATPase, and Fis domain